MTHLTKEEEKEFEDFYWECGKYQNRELGIDEYKSFIANLTHSREQELIEKVIECLEESKSQINGGGNGRRVLTQAIIKVRSLIK